MSITMLKRDLGTGDLCDNIGLIGISAKWSYVIASPSHHASLLCMLAIPIFPILKFEDFLFTCLTSFFSLIQTGIILL